MIPSRLLVSVFFTLNVAGLCLGADPRRSKEEHLKIDASGDPLPKGALLRLGTTRLRPPSLLGVAWSPDGKMLASSGYGKPIRLWEVATGKEIRRFPGKELVTSAGDGLLAWSPDGKMIASGYEDYPSSIHLWDVATGKLVAQLPAHEIGVDALAWSPDSKILASGENQERIQLWDVTTGKQISRVGQS